MSSALARGLVYALGLVGVVGAGMPAQQATPPTTPAPTATAPQPGGRGVAPLTVPPGGFMFVQLSDTQFGFSNSDKDFVQDTANAEFAVATVNRLKPAFVIITGDLVNKPGDAAQMAEYARVVAKIDRAIPRYDVAGNHDVENAPTPASLAAYRARVGKDIYTFRHGPLLGLVLNSSIIHSPQDAQAEYAAQDQWLRAELPRARASGAKHVVIFQHHPWFLQRADEPDQYFNIPRVRRDPLLQLFRESGITTLISGHLHRATEADDAGLRSIVTGPVSRPLGGQSGLRVFVVTDTEIRHRYYSFGEIPYSIEPASAAGRGRGGSMR